MEEDAGGALSIGGYPILQATVAQEIEYFAVAAIVESPGSRHGTQPRQVPASDALGKLESLASVLTAAGLYEPEQAGLWTMLTEE